MSGKLGRASGPFQPCNSGKSASSIVLKLLRFFSELPVSRPQNTCSYTNLPIADGLSADWRSALDSKRPGRSGQPCFQIIYLLFGYGWDGDDNILTFLH